MKTQIAVRSLDEIADSIRSHYERGVRETYFAIGHDLLEARAQFPGDREFGRWVEVQGFPFSTNWARTLRLAAGNESAVRDVLVSQLTSGKSENFDRAVRTVLHPPADEPEEPAEREVRTGRNRITVTEARRLIRVVQGNLAMLQPDEVVPMARPVVRELAPVLMAWVQAWSQPEEDA